VNTIATAIFALAVLHTFVAGRIATAAHGRPLLRFLGEVEVVFGLWAVPLIAAMAAVLGWDPTNRYLTQTVSYREPLFVIVIMALAATAPIMRLAESSMRLLANLAGGSPAAWWASILLLGPLLGSFITEPAAMTISALLLGRQFFELHPGRSLRYATLGLLFVNVSIGGTLTHFAAPPVLMVAAPWGWDTPFMLAHIGWRAALAIAVSTLACYAIFRRELAALPPRPAARHADAPIPAWMYVVHVAFMAWTVFTAHYPVFFLGGFLLFIGFARATARWQSRMDLTTPLLVGFFLAGLVVHGGLQGWWIQPLLSSLGREALFSAATLLTAFNDNALITYLATLVPQLDESFRIAVVQGAVAGGGLTVIANAPNPAGQALLSKFFGGAVHPLGLMAGAALPTVIAVAAFRLL
jgi:hypothetical protein